MAARRDSRHRDYLPRGSADRPGHAHLAQIHEFLHVGNEIAAAHAPDGYFRCVVSTVPPRDRNGRRDERLATHALFFEDGLGRETIAGEGVAKRQIVRGAAVVKAALDNGERTLVHCAYGQNRSTAICIAYAVLHKKWEAGDAAEYICEMIVTQRRYAHPAPCSNPVFLRLVAELEPQPLDETENARASRASAGAPTSEGLTVQPAPAAAAFNAATGTRTGEKTRAGSRPTTTSKLGKITAWLHPR